MERVAHNAFPIFIEEAVSRLTEAKNIILATSAFDRVTARIMSHVNADLIIMFQTGKASEKASQIEANPNIAFVLDNMQIEAKAKIIGHPSENPIFMEMYKQKHPNSFAAYTNLPDEILITASPTKITFYKYASDKPFRHICMIPEKKIYVEWIL